MKFLYLSIFILTCLSVFTQEQVMERRNYPVIEGNDTLFDPWVGGLNAPQFSKIDLNQDGVEDLFLFERGFDAAIKTFVFEDGEYHYAPEYISKFPQMRNWVLLADYNCDGKADIFCWSETGAGIALYKNTSTVQGGLSFELVYNLIYTDGLSGDVNLYVSSVDYPAITDIDNDGDLDIVTFGIGGTYIEYHRNYAMESHGTCDSVDFVLEESCWGLITEDGLTNDLVLDISCKGGSGGEQIPQGERHSGSTVLAFDADGDLDKDILLGDISYANLVYARNGGDLTYAHMDTTINQYPNNTVPVNIELFPVGYHLDFDNDGDKELIASPNSPGFSRDVSNIWLYDNVGSDLAPDFQFIKSDLFQGDMIDVGTGAHPKMVDVDGDGLLDLLVFNEYKFSSNGLYTNITYYKNYGTETSPVFKLEDSNFMNFLDNELKGANAAFGDIDGDGDLDMFVGDAEGEIHWYNNTAGVGSFMTFQLVAFNYNLIDVGTYSAPFLFDVNGDDLLDLVIGEKNGELNLIVNSGDANNPEFAIQDLIQDFGGVDVEIPCCTGYSTPFLHKNEGDSIYLYVGSEEGYVYIYRGLENNLDGNFYKTDSIDFLSVKVSPYFADLDNDGYRDWIVGENYGGLQIYEDTIQGPGSVGEFEDFDFKMYPNPVRDQLSIESSVEIISVSVYDFAGRLIYSEGLNGDKEFIYKAGTLSEGVYVIELKSKNGISRQSFVRIE